LGGKPLEADKRYKVAGWAPVAERVTGEPVWDVVERYLKDRKTIKPRAPNMPRLIGMEKNRGLA
jgi:S-sulfosulfanyl-L-cysteine sulfohydrolase